MTTNPGQNHSFRALHITRVAVFVALMMIGANITSFIPFLVIAGVPITLQAFFALLAGVILGSRLGAVAMLAYIIIGLAGAPVFSRFSGGLGSLISPTFGFLISFVLVAYVAGKIVEVSFSKGTYYLASFAALLLTYIIGLHWFYFAFKIWLASPEGFSYTTALLMMLPAFIKDFFLAILATSLGFKINQRLRRF